MEVNASYKTWFSRIRDMPLRCPHLPKCLTSNRISSQRWCSIRWWIPHHLTHREEICIRSSTKLRCHSLSRASCPRSLAWLRPIMTHPWFMQIWNETSQIISIWQETSHMLLEVKLVYSTLTNSLSRAEETTFWPHHPRWKELPSIQIITIQVSTKVWASKPSNSANHCIGSQKSRQPITCPTFQRLTVVSQSTPCMATSMANKIFWVPSSKPNSPLLRRQGATRWQIH